MELQSTFNLVYLLVWCSIHHVNGQTRTQFVKAMLMEYDNKVTPTFDKGTSTNVDVALYINSIDSISETTMDFSINAFVIQEWIDPRIQFFGLIEAPYLELDSKLIDDVWVPDLYFANEKKASFHTVTVPNKMLHLYSNGKVIYRLRVSITATCPMKLHSYPMDSQICSLYIQSFAYSTNSLQFSWRKTDPVRQNRYLTLPQFELNNVVNKNCSEDRDQGNFTCIAVDFYLSRNIGFYMIQIYVPSMLVVLLSWVSFWLNVDAVPARISLGILTVLTMTTQKSMAVSSLPKVSYIKAIDVWMAACLSFVFVVLLEFALVNVLDRRQIKRPAKYNVVADGDEKLQLQNELVSGNARDRWMTDPLGRQKATRVDQISRLFFPFAFVVFNVGYWAFYSNQEM